MEATAQIDGAVLVPYHEPTTIRPPKPAHAMAVSSMAGCPETSKSKSAPPSLPGGRAPRPPHRSSAVHRRPRPPRPPDRAPLAGARASVPEPRGLPAGNVPAQAVARRPMMPCPSRKTRSPMTGRPSMTRLTAVSIAARKTASSASATRRRHPDQLRGRGQRNGSGGAGRQIRARRPRPGRPGARPPPPSPRCCSRKPGGRRKAARP